MAYDNYADSTTLLYHKAGTGASIDYSSLSLNSSILDKEQIVVIRKFTTTVEYNAAAAPDGFGGVYPDGQEWWTAWTLPVGSTSSMYTLDAETKTITMSTDASNYVWTRKNSDGTTTDINLPVFNATTDDVIVLRKTYALDNFVNWMSGTRVTSKNLNLNADQLLHLLQELVSNFRREDLVNPFIGAANGICGLDSSGVVPEANIGANSFASSLNSVIFTAGDGLSGGGTLGANRSFAVDLSTSVTNGLSIYENKLAMQLGTSLTKSGDLVIANLATGGALIDSGSGIALDALTTLSAIDAYDGTDKAVSSSAVKELNNKVDTIGQGVRFLGGLDPTTKATATVTMTGIATADETIIITSTDGTAKTYTAKAAQDASANQFQVNATPATQAENLKLCIEHSAGHNGKITVVRTDGALALTQRDEGANGNKPITEGLSNATATNFTGGTDGVEPSTPDGGFLRGDTFDVLHDGFTSDTWSDSTWTEVAVTQGHDVKYNGTAWESIPPVSTVDLSDYVRKDGTTAFTGNVNFSGNKINNVGTPLVGTDVANKTYADSVVGGKKLQDLSDVETYTGTSVPTDDKSILVWRPLGGGGGWQDIACHDFRFTEFKGIEETSAADGDVLSYDLASTTWKPSSAYGLPQIWSSGANTITGGLAVDGVGGYGDGNTVTFNLTVAPKNDSVESFLVSIDGALQVPGSTGDFTSITRNVDTNSGTITFSSPPPYGSAISIYNTGKLTNLPPDTFVASASSSVPLTIKGASGQSANLQEWKESGGEVLASVSSAGILDVPAVTVGGLASLPIRQISNTQLLYTNSHVTSYKASIEDYEVTGVYNSITPLSTNSSILVFWNLRYAAVDSNGNNAFGNAGIVVGNTAVTGISNNGTYTTFAGHEPFTTFGAAGTGWSSAYEYGNRGGMFIIPSSQHTLDPLRLDIVSAASSGDTLTVYPSYSSLIMIEIGG